jgi:hypothetical protein
MERRILAAALACNGDNVSLTACVPGTTREKLRWVLFPHRLACPGSYRPTRQSMASTIIKIKVLIRWHDPCVVSVDYAWAH